MSNLRHDHSNCIIETEEPYKKLGEYGFKIDLEEVVEHQGNAFCRFIMFNNGYLEFIEIKGKKTDANFSIEEKDSQPGFSFISDDNLEKLFNESKENFQHFDIKFSHKNYNWKENSTEHLPGWNFVAFNQFFVPGICTWVTEKDANKNIIEKSSMFHKNGCTELIGAYWIHSSNKDIQPLSNFLKKPYKNGQIIISNDFKLYVDTPDNHFMELYDLYKNEVKKNPYKAIIIGCENLEKFKQFSGLENKIYFDGKQAYRIIQNKLSWDLIIVEN